MTNELQQRIYRTPTGEVCYVPPIHYDLEGNSLLVNDGRSLVCREGTAILHNAGASVLHIENSAGARFEGLSLESPSSNVGISPYGNTNTGLRFERIRVKGCNYSIAPGSPADQNDFFTFSNCEFRSAAIRAVWQRHGMNTNWKFYRCLFAAVPEAVDFNAKVFLERCYFQGCPLELVSRKNNIQNSRIATLLHCESEHGQMALLSDALLQYTASHCGWHVNTPDFIDFGGILGGRAYFTSCDFAFGSNNTTNVKVDPGREVHISGRSNVTFTGIGGGTLTQNTFS